MPDILSIIPGKGSFTSAGSPTIIAGKFIENLRRPSRLRGRLSVALFISLFLIITYAAKSHRDDIKHYVVTSFSNPYYSIPESETARWRDDNSNNSTESTVQKPKFHLLIQARTSSPGLCNTLVSAAILNYPPPTLVGYGTGDNREKANAGAIEDTLGFLLGKEAREDDLALIVDERTWFQLPAQVLVDRYEALVHESDARLLAKYGTHVTNEPGKSPQGIFKERVIFGAEKSCLGYEPGDVACYGSPPSILPNDMYGPATDTEHESSKNRPRYLYAPNMIGGVGDLRALFKYAHKKLDTKPVNSSTQYIFSDLFGQQELQREKARKQSLSTLSAFKEWLTREKSSGNQMSLHIDRHQPEDTTYNDGENREFGIGLDYSSSIFQVLDKSADDIHFIAFNHPTLINSPSRLSASTFSKAIGLPIDLKSSALPFKLHSTPVQGAVSDLPLLEIDKLPINTPWTDIDLATNVMVPGAGIPSSLSFYGEGTKNLKNKWWKKMWYHQKARALMRRYMRSPAGHIAAEAAEKGGEEWWDLRGGKGGVWTDAGQYLEWNEICGAYDADVFGDGLGVFGQEDESNLPVYNKFGKLVSGKPDDKEKNKAT